MLPFLNRLIHDFLICKKPEAQAREAQIELALERVRARTMAMQRSDELAEVATVLFQQVKALVYRNGYADLAFGEIDDKGIYLVSWKCGW